MKSEVWNLYLLLECIGFVPYIPKVSILKPKAAKLEAIAMTKNANLTIKLHAFLGFELWTSVKASSINNPQSPAFKQYGFQTSSFGLQVMISLKLNPRTLRLLLNALILGFRLGLCNIYVLISLKSEKFEVIAMTKNAHFTYICIDLVTCFF